MRRRLLVLPHRRQQPPSTRPNTGPFSKQRVLSRNRKAATSLPAPVRSNQADICRFPASTFRPFSSPLQAQQASRQPTAMAPTAPPLSRMGATPGRASIRPTISQTAAIHRLPRHRPEGTTRRLRAITAEARATMRPRRLPHRIRAPTPMPTGSSRRTSKTAADTTARRREGMRITGQISEAARPWSAGE